MADILSSESEGLVKQLECPVCMSTMKPPIYICPTGHSICNGCYGFVVDCPQCFVSYGKIIGDRFEGQKLMTFKCPGGCKVTANHLYGNRHSVKGNGHVNELCCRSCAVNFSCVSYKGSLILNEKFEELRAAFRPPRNYSLEAVAGYVFYPCEVEECGGKFKLSEEKDHKALCNYRAIDCPSADCTWKGPVNELNEHFRGAAEWPDAYGVQLHRFAQKREKFNIWMSNTPGFQEVAIFSDKMRYPDSAFTFQLIVSQDQQLSFSLLHCGSVDSGKNIVGKVTFFSQKDPNYFRSFGFPVQNDFLAETQFRTDELPSEKWLRENEFFDSTGNLTVEVDFWRAALPITQTTNKGIKHQQTTAAGDGHQCGSQSGRKQSKVQ